MKSITHLLLTLTISINVYSQEPSNRELSKVEISKIYTNGRIAELKIEYPIFKIYEYIDNKGKHHLILTENTMETQKEGIWNDAIRGYSFLVKDGSWTLEWNLKDFILPDGNPNSKESSIWFWTTLLTLEDINNDGTVEPIIIYGTSGINGTGDGRIKILTYYKGVKKAIRHQNGILDFQRSTQVDQSFYELPEVIQIKVKSLMQKIIEVDKGIFPAGWKDAMNNRKLTFDE